MNNSGGVRPRLQQNKNKDIPEEELKLGRWVSAQVKNYDPDPAKCKSISNIDPRVREAWRTFITE